MSRIAFTFALLLLMPLIGFAQTTWYVDDDNTGGPWDGSQTNPFQYIQDGIDAAVGGDTVLVLPGYYIENIDFLGKAITVKSDQGPEVTTIDGNQAGSVVTFDDGEESDSTVNAG